MKRHNLPLVGVVTTVEWEATRTDLGLTHLSELVIPPVQTTYLPALREEVVIGWSTTADQCEERMACTIVAGRGVDENHHQRSGAER